MSLMPVPSCGRDRFAAAGLSALCALLLTASPSATAVEYSRLDFGLEVPAEIRSTRSDRLFIHQLPADTLVGGMGFLNFLPAGIDIQGYARDLRFGLELVSISGHTGWPAAAIVRPYQVIDLAGQVHLDLVAEMGLPQNVKIDAVTIASDGGIEFSVDRYIRFQNETYSPADLLHFDGTSLQRRFDAEAALVPPGVNLDAAHRVTLGQSNGLLLLSFDVAVVANGITVQDEDLALATNDTLLGLSNDLDAVFPGGIEDGNDLDAVSAIAQFPGFIVISVPASVIEGQDSEIRVSVSRFDGSEGALSIGLLLTPGGSGQTLPAVSGVDYLDPATMANWVDGETNITREISIPVLDNNQSVGDRSITIQPSLAAGTEWLGQPLVVVIREDDIQGDIFRDGFESASGAP
jgi:hypothetical protein